MIRHILFIALVTSLLLGMSSKRAFSDVLADEQNSDVSMTITKFHVDDQTLELGWKIVNNSDHDVWVCDSIDTHPGFPDFEVFMAGDNQTLVIRRRFDLAIAVTLEGFLRSRYVRLHGGEERDESLTLQIPASRISYFEAETGRAEYARSLALEIGFYNEDLRELILNIVSVAEKLDCADPLIPPLDIEDIEIRNRYFSELLIARTFNSSNWPYFKESVEDGGEEILIPHMGQAFNTEKALRMTLNNISIPIRSLPAADESPLSETEPAEVTMALTGFDVNDTHLELSWKIKNNTDHNVWICESMSRDYPPPLFEQFLDEDAKTLVIRKLFNLPMSWYEYPPIGGRYVRLYPGEEKVESVFVALPVRPYQMTVANKVTNAEYAECLALEIGYYDEDLPALILEIVEISEHLNIDFSVGYHGFSKGVRDRFFGGPIVALLFKGMLGFEPSVRSADADGEMWMPDLDGIRMGEKILRIEIEGVSIPYKSNYPPLND